MSDDKFNGESDDVEWEDDEEAPEPEGTAGDETPE